jgi:hypothetical protein
MDYNVDMAIPYTVRLSSEQHYDCVYVIVLIMKLSFNFLIELLESSKVYLQKGYANAESLDSNWSNSMHPVISLSETHMRTLPVSNAAKGGRKKACKHRMVMLSHLRPKILLHH